VNFGMTGDPDTVAAIADAAFVDAPEGDGSLAG
jgi:hypothetical protein